MDCCLHDCNREEGHCAVGVDHCVVEGCNARIEQWVAGEGGNGESGNNENGGESQCAVGGRTGGEGHCTVGVDRCAAGEDCYSCKNSEHFRYC